MGDSLASPPSCRCGFADGSGRGRPTRDGEEEQTSRHPPLLPMILVVGAGRWGLRGACAQPPTLTSSQYRLSSSEVSDGVSSSASLGQPRDVRRPPPPPPPSSPVTICHRPIWLRSFLLSGWTSTKEFRLSSSPPSGACSHSMVEWWIPSPLSPSVFSSFSRFLFHTSKNF
jgi:hypothetical protein